MTVYVQAVMHSILTGAIYLAGVFCDDLLKKEMLKDKKGDEGLATLLG